MEGRQDPMSSYTYKETIRGEKRMDLKRRNCRWSLKPLLGGAGRAGRKIKGGKLKGREDLKGENFVVL